MRRLTLLLVLVLLTIPGWGQTVTASIQGIVDDEKGAVIPGAKVTLTSETTGISKTAQTDQAGHYQILFIDPGTYSVAVAATGFQPEKQTGVVVELFQARPVNFSLKVGNVSEQVVVNESVTPPLDTATSSMGQVVTQKLLNDVPLNGRNVFDLAALTPGVNTTGSSGIPHIGGSRNLNNEQQIDGVTNVLPENNIGNNSSVYTPILESVQEVSVRTSVLPAEYGRYSGGVISLVTKSGSNQFHGTGWEFTRNAVLNARNYFDLKTSKKPDSHDYKTGGTIGGPIIIPHIYNGRKRSFFFFAYQDARSASAVNALNTVPLPAFRNGDFSQLGYPIYDPSIPTKKVGNDYVRTLMPGNGYQIPVARISQLGSNIIKYYPAPNIDPAHWADPFHAQASDGSTFSYNRVDSGLALNPGHQFDLRLDHDIMSRWHTFLRLSHGVAQFVPFRTLGENNIASPTARRTKTSSWSMSFNHIFTFTPTIFAEVRYGYATSNFNAKPYFPAFDVASLGFPAYFAQLANSQAQGSMTQFSPSGYASLGSPGTATVQHIEPFAHDVVASLVKIAGSHTLKFGGEYRRITLQFMQLAYPAGVFNPGKSLVQKYSNRQESSGESQAAYGASGLKSGDAIAELLLGYADSGQVTHTFQSKMKSPYIAFYGQDDWRVTRRLTLNFGLRWDVDIPRTEDKNRLSYWDSTLPSPMSPVVDPSGAGDKVFPGGSCFNCSHLMGQMVFTGTKDSKHGRQQAPTQWKDFAPRIGFAFSPNEHFVIRGGYGINYAPSAAQAAGVTGGAGTEGFSSVTTYQSVVDAQGTIVSPGIIDPFPFGFNLPKGAASGPLTDVAYNVYDNFVGTDYRNPYSEEWNLNVQSSLPGKLTIEAGYLGNHGVFLIDGDPGRTLNQVQTSYLSLGQSALQTQVPNPFYGIITTAQFPNGQGWSRSTIGRNQLMRPFPQYGILNRFRGPGAASMYHAFTIRADKRFTSGLSFIASFTGSKLMDNSAAAITFGGPVSGTHADQYNPRLEWAISPQDVSRTLVTGFTYELPFGPGRRYLHDTSGLVRFLVSGWGSSGLVTYYTGNPVVIASTADNTFLLSGASQRPAWSGRSAKLSNPSRNQWFNNVTDQSLDGTGKFKSPWVFGGTATYGSTANLAGVPVIGNAPRTIPNVRNPSAMFTNIGFLKNNRWGSKENYNLQFRFDMFNIFNHPNWGAPNANVTNPNYGKITTASNARQAQLGLRFVF